MWHSIDFPLSVLNSPEDRVRKFLQLLGQVIFFRRGFVRSGSGLCVGSDTTIWVKGTNGAVALLEDIIGLLKQRLDVLDKLLLVELILRRFLCPVNVLIEGQ
jgi:hypothetical protein